MVTREETSQSTQEKEREELRKQTESSKDTPDTTGNKQESHVEADEIKEQEAPVEKGETPQTTGETEEVKNESDDSGKAPVEEEEEPESMEALLAGENQSENERMLELYEKTFSNIQPGQIVKGVVISTSDKEVLVDINYKSEGAIPINEFSNNEIPEKFDEVYVFINAIEDGEGKLKLSKKKADFFMNLERLREILKSNKTVKGVLKRRVKGGMIAEILGLEAFLPGSQISLKPIPNLDQFIGKESEFKLLKLDEERRNIIVSRKLVLEESLETRREELRDKIEIGTELDGEVKNITDYGAFIDLGGIDGLLHITDMSWGRIKHPSEMLNIGDKLKVKVIAYDEDADRVSLGLKQLVPHPWENIEVKYPEGTKVTGKVVNITAYGAFIELEPGVEGLVHVSEMSWTKKITRPNQVVKVGDTIDAIVLSVSREQQRISLGMKQMEPNPWLTFDERYPVGTVITRPIKSITPFGVFVEIEDDIDGLIHISDISWTKRIYHPKEVYKIGQEIEARILSIDKALHRIALGVKQLEDDPWIELDRILPVNTEVTGSITKLIPKGILVDVDVDGTVVEGFVPMSHLGIPRTEKLQFAFDVGEKIPLKVIELDTENRRLILSVKAYFFGKNREQRAEFIQEHESRIQERRETARAAAEQKKSRKLKQQQAQEEESQADTGSEQPEVGAVQPDLDEENTAQAAEDTPPEQPEETPQETPAGEPATEETVVEEPEQETETVPTATEPEDTTPEEEPETGASTEEIVDQPESPAEEPVPVSEEEKPEEDDPKPVDHES